MDMQTQPIMNASNIDALAINSNDIYNSGTTTTNHLNIDGNLTFTANSMIYVDGLMVNPSDLQNASFVSPILNSGYEERITRLELENKALKEKLNLAVDRIEFLAKWSEV